MQIHQKPIDSITKDDIEYLIKNQIPEGYNLEYKESISENRDKFLESTTAFANADGGILIIGIREVKNNETDEKVERYEICGLMEDIDELICKMENWLRDHVQDRLLGYQIVPIKLDGNKTIILIKIEKSLNPPHMVKVSKNQRFYIRNSAGKHEMDIHEIRASVLSGYYYEEKALEFIELRQMKLEFNKGVLPLSSRSGLLVIHLIPIMSLKDRFLYPSKALSENNGNLEPLTSYNYSKLYNIHGYVNYSIDDASKKVISYVQFFRNGSIEAVDCFGDQLIIKKSIPVHEIQNKLSDRIYKYLKCQAQIGVQPPILLQVALIGVRDYMTSSNSMASTPFKNQIFEDNINLQDITINEYPVDKNEFEKLLVPVSDSLWNATGYDGSRR